MRRADKRTPEQISIQRYTNLLGLPDRDLCQVDHHTSALPAPYPACGWEYVAEQEDTAVVVVCQRPGEWGTFQAGRGARRGCTGCVARLIRARLWLQRRRLQRGMT